MLIMTELATISLTNDAFGKCTPGWVITAHRVILSILNILRDVKFGNFYILDK